MPGNCITLPLLYLHVCHKNSGTEKAYVQTVAYPGFFFWGGGGVQQIQWRTQERENGDLGVVAPPSQGFWRQL